VVAVAEPPLVVLTTATEVVALVVIAHQLELQVVERLQRVLYLYLQELHTLLLLARAVPQ
jgi:hypothetical protein